MARKAETEAPDVIQLSATLIEWSEAHGFSRAVLESEAAKMIDWHKANGRRRSDWPATLRNWLRKSREFKGEPLFAETTTKTAAPKPGMHVCRVHAAHEWACTVKNCGHSYFLACPEAIKEIQAGKFR